MIIPDIRDSCENTSAAAQAKTRKKAENYLIKNPGRREDIRDSKYAALPHVSWAWANTWSRNCEKVADEKRAAGLDLGIIKENGTNGQINGN